MFPNHNQPLLPSNAGRKKTAIPIVLKLNVRPELQRPLDPGAKTMIWQQALGHIGNEDWIARIRVAGPDFLDRQIVRQVTGTDDLDAVIKNEDTDRRIDEIISVHQGIDQ